MMNTSQITIHKSGFRAALKFSLAAFVGMSISGTSMAARAQGSPQIAAPTAGSAVAPTDVTGVWIDHTGRGAVEILPCGTKVCGYVYWVKDTLSKQGQPILDSKNPDSARRNKPICGTQVLVNLVKEKPAAMGYVWGRGSIYDPEQGETFDAEIKLVTESELSVLGYLGMKFLGETFKWKRAPSTLARCGPARV